MQVMPCPEFSVGYLLRKPYTGQAGCGPLVVMIIGVGGRASEFTLVSYAVSWLCRCSRVAAAVGSTQLVRV